ncbi:lantibiotic dehydratase [Tenacibaculum jejuense]|uniref:Lantibiotic dehydratase n=1 Tax=Tenacibaculum jejuense TaxID=584609 RepID=A0A238U5J4_9FLAO|nr:lantibiotic dehydratase [Tenacibaculum jejuense]SNR14473.1 protein of unknown function [Tenacibaculum jejuense]
MIKNSFSKSIIRIPKFPFSDLKKILSIENENLFFETIVSNNDFMHGILVSSPDFYYELKKVNTITDSKKKEKIKIALLKYFIRSTTRCIPFGLFSGLGIVENISSEEENGLKIINSYQRTRLDSQLSYKIFNSYINNEFISKHLLYFPNSTLYKVGNKYRYIEHTLTENSFLKFEFSEITKNKYLKEILKLVKEGNKYVKIVDFLISKGFSKEDSENYINSLIVNKVIVSELEISTVDSTIEKQLNTTFKKVINETSDNEIKNISNYLQDKITTLEKIDSKEIQESIKDTASIIEVLKNDSENQNNNYLHKDLYFNIQGSFSDSQYNLIQEAIDVLNTLLLENEDHLTDLNNFKDAFYKKYETKTVPLPLALDLGIGIGYGNTLNSSGKENNKLIEGFPYNSNNTFLKKTLTLSSVDSFLIRKIEKNRNSDAIVITEKELLFLKNLNKSYNKTNPTSTVRFSLFKSEDNNDFIHIKSIAETSPNKILGRFSLSNKGVKKLCEEIALFENQSFGEDTIVAEIDHLPDTVSGNLIMRSKIRDFKINYIGGSNYNEKNIDVSDLLLSLQGDELILFSKKLNKRVIPYFSSSYDEMSINNIPIFKFLLDLRAQYESKKKWSIDIKKIHNLFLHIPRITFKNIIISKESWYIISSNFFEKENNSLDIAIQNFNYNCQKLKLPRYFVILEEDREFLIDTHNSSLSKLFLKELQKKKQLQVQEFLLEHYKSIFQEGDDEKQFNNEFFYFIKNKTAKLNRISLNKSNKKTIKRSFSLGSEWIYFKIYIDSKVTDALLIKLERKLLDLLKKKKIKSFFFIKFTDPNYHIRLRILINDEYDFNPIISQISKVLKKYFTNYISDIKLDTYKRELERYGGSDIVYFENIFFEDSKLVINILKNYKNVLKEKWFYSLIIIDVYCNLFKFSLDEKIAFAKYVENYFSDEFNYNKNTQVYISRQYNNFKKDSLFLLQNYNTFDLDIGLDEFKKNIKEEINKISIKNKTQERQFLMSLIHMHIIRLLGAHKNRLYEFMIYSIYSKSLKTLSYINKDFV